jgi:hypothetical protein
MKISGIIKDLEEIMKTSGDIEGLIEIEEKPGEPKMVPVGEISLENRPGFGPSIAFLQ